MKLTLLMLLAVIVMMACQQQHSKQEIQPDNQEKVALPVIDVYTIGEVSEDLCEAMLDSLKNHYPNCRLTGKLPLPRSAYYPPRHRYLADSLVSYLESKHSKDNIVVGLTAVDISLCNFRGHDNYGIMGLTNRVGGGVCVFSNYRKKSKDGMFQLMRHELGHAVGLRHCKTAGCLMHDAEGKDLKGGTFCQTCDFSLTKKRLEIIIIQ